MAGLAPGESFCRQDLVDQEDERGERDQRDVERRPHLHEERHVVCSERHRGREHEAAEPRVGRGARIGDHEEREDQERAALQLMDRNGERIAEPPGACEQQRGVAAEKEDRHVGAARRVQHQDREEAEQRGEPDC